MKEIHLFYMIIIPRFKNIFYHEKKNVFPVHWLIEKKMFNGMLKW